MTSGCRLAAATLVLLLPACGGRPMVPSATPALLAPTSHVRHRRGATPIEHVVLVVQENRTFNNLFATFPGATGSTVGDELIAGKLRRIKLAEVTLKRSKNLNHSYAAFLTSYDNGKMDGFDLVNYWGKTREGSLPYQYVDPGSVRPYWDIAKQYALAEAMFTTQGSASFPAHQDLIRGGTAIDADDSLIGNPSYEQAWGCDSVAGTTTTLITRSLEVKKNAGPFPCTSSFPDYASNGYKTLRDLLDANDLSWKYYTPALGDPGAVWNAFDVIAAVRYGPEWGSNVNWPETNVFNDIAQSALPSMCWVIPDGENSDHPGRGSDTGPSWVANIVNAVGRSPYWNSSAIIVVWDDWGGFYDPVAPPLPRDRQGGPGFRVPMIVISPYTRQRSTGRPGYISKTIYSFGSIIRFIEDTFDLSRLGTTDTTSNSISDMFDFHQAPRKFRAIASKYSRSYFMHQRPSRQPVDTQ